MQRFRGEMNIFKKGIIFIFISMLLISSIGYFEYLLDHGIDEFRNFEDYEGLLDDSILHKDDVISCWAEINEKLNISIFEDQVIFGRNNFLFLGNHYGSTHDYFRGIKSFSEKDIENIMNVINSFDEFFSSKDIPFLYVISPNKSTIYSENLPLWLPRNKNVETPRQLLSSFIKENESNIPILDLSPILMKAKIEYGEDKGDYLYHNSDSHWSSVGALIGFNEMMYELGFIGEEKVIPNESSFNVEFSNQKRDLTSLIALNNFIDFDVQLDSNSKSGEKILISKNDKVYWNSLFYLENPDAIFDKRILLIRDSFSQAQLDYYNYYFSEVYYVAFTFFLRDNYIESEFYSNFYSIDPDIVILQTVERYLDTIFRFSPMIKHHTYFEKGEELYKFDNDDFDDEVLNKFSYINDNDQIILEMKDIGASLVVSPNEMAGLKEVFVKLRINVEKNSECFLNYKTDSGEFSQNFDLIPGDNLLYYSLTADESISEVSLSFEEFIDESILLYEFELRK